MDSRDWGSVEASALAAVQGVLTDIDDTLTRHGAIEPAARAALHKLRRAGLPALAITGRPMGWSEPFVRDGTLDAIVAALREAYPTIQEVVGHDDISPGRKVDPGPAFPMSRFQNQGGAAGSGTLRDNDLGEFEVVVRDTLNLRGGPGTGFAVLKALKPGTKLRVLREAGEWRQVDLQGDGTPDGFVHGDFLRRIGS